MEKVITYSDIFYKFLVIVACAYLGHASFIPHPAAVSVTDINAEAHKAPISWPAEFTFTCNIPNPDDPNVPLPLNPDGNYQDPINCNQYYACSGLQKPYSMPCPADLYYVDIPDICSYKENNGDCPNYWLDPYVGVGANGCPMSLNRSAPLMVPTFANDNCQTYLTCYNTYLNKPPVLGACPSDYFFSFQSMGCVSNTYKSDKNCNETAAG